MADCFDEGQLVNKGRIPDQDVMDVVQELQRARDPNKARNGLLNVENSIFETGTFLVKGVDLAKKVEKRNRLINIIKEHELTEIAERSYEQFGTLKAGLEAKLVGVNMLFDGAQDSVAAKSNALLNQYGGGVIYDLEQAKLLSKFDSMGEDFERQVARVLSDLNQPKPTRDVDASPEAVKIGEILFKYQRAMLQRKNQAGAYVQLKAGRVVSQSHDPGKMAGKQAEWTAYIREKLDFDRMGIEPERQDKFLELAYNAIVTGIREPSVKQSDDIVDAFRGPQNLAKRESAHGVFTFKSADDWYDYNKEFGQSSFREAYLGDLQSGARAVALLENFGTNPEAMLGRVVDRLSNKYKNDANAQKAVAEMRGETKTLFKLDNYMAEATGSVNIGATNTMAQYSTNIRSLQTMAKLGGSWISALSDTAFMATNRIYQGRSVMDAWGDAFTAVFQGLGNAERKDMADRLLVGLEGQLGDYFGRFDVTEGASGGISKAMGVFFKLNLLQPWTNSNKRGVSLMLANDFGKLASKKFNDLPDAQRRMFKLYGIDEAQWDGARAVVENDSRGRPFLMPDQITDQKTREAFQLLINNEAEFSVPSPGERERGILRQGLQANTVEGQAIRFIGQFKSFGVTVFTRVLGRQIYGYGAATKGQQFRRGLGANAGIINAIVGTTVLGYFIMQAKEVLRGREPRPNTPETFIAAMLQGGALGIYGDFLFGEANRYGSGMLETVAGPTLGTASDVADLLLKYRNVALGGDENIGGDTIRLIKSNTPFANLFYTKQVMDYMIWYQLQEMINPGYLERAERRSMSATDQGYLLRPSDIVATGGGFR